VNTRFKFFPESLFRNAVILSLFLHSLLWTGFLFKGSIDTFSKNSNTLEIDLTKPFRIGGNPLLKPGGGTVLNIPKEKVGPQIPSEIVSPEKTAAPKEWLLPESKESPTENPEPAAGHKTEELIDTNAGGSGEGFSGTGGGWGGGVGEGGGIALSRFPKLINRSEILKLLKKLYPSAERQAGLRGVVLVDLHLTPEGKVQTSEVVESGGAAFDEVAKEVSKKMKFSAAYVGDNPVAVKIRQSIIFQLED